MVRVSTQWSTACSEWGTEPGARVEVVHRKGFNTEQDFAGAARLKYPDQPPRARSCGFGETARGELDYLALPLEAR